MFESLTESLNGIFRKLRGTAVISEANTRDALREIRTALLEADVSYKVVKIVHDELVELMGPVDHAMRFAEHPPTVIMLAGLQGSGKTTTAGKLGRYLQQRGHSPMLVAADVQRPAAVHQLRVLGEQLHMPVYSEEAGRPPRICERSIDAARHANCDIVIFDTAGRLHIDEALMAELSEIKSRAKPQQIFLVCDAMTGQDAVNSAAEFNARLDIDGVILTKLDGDARGGAALSIKAVTGKPVKFIGVGEKLDAIEEFHPDRMASRILGMGDVVTLVEKVQAEVDEKRARVLQEKIRTRSLTLEDFLQQLQQLKKMGNIQDMLGLLPGMGGVDFSSAQDEIPRVEAIIRSMTPQERNNPEIIDSSRRRRIAAGSGSNSQEINHLLKQFRQMMKLMKRFGESGKGPKGFGLPAAGGRMPHLGHRPPMPGR